MRVTFIHGAHAKVVEHINQSSCDLATFAAGITLGRVNQLHFTPPYLQNETEASTTIGNRCIQAWQDIDQSGTVVAVIKGTLHQPVMRRWPTGARLLAQDSPFAREQEVRLGQADVFMIDYAYVQRLLAIADWARLITPPSPYHLSPCAHAVRLGDELWYACPKHFVSDIQREGRLKDAAVRHQLSPMLVSPQ